jgi:erythrin-vacuolar iron transport family protein
VVSSTPCRSCCLPFLLPGYHTALAAAVAAVELVLLAWLRSTFLETSFAQSFVLVALGGAVISAISAGLGVAAS